MAPFGYDSRAERLCAVHELCNGEEHRRRFGASGYRIESAGELAPALRTALSSNKLTIIDCPVDASANLRLTQRLSTLTVESGFHP